MKPIKIISYLALFFVFSCINTERKLIVTDAVFTNSVNNYKPKMIAPGIISKASFEGHASITPLHNEMYFAVYSNDHAYSTIAYATKKNNTWSEPKIASFSGIHSDGSPALSPEGNKLFFSSKRPIKGREPNFNTDIWYVERKNEKSLWSKPIHLKNSINTQYNEFSPSVDAEGNLYFCSNRPDGFGDMDVYYSKYTNGYYEDAVLLKGNINTEYQEGNVGVSPDGNLLFIMVQHKPDGYGYDDIYYTTKYKNEWVEAKNLGNIVNTYTYDFSPKVSPDGKTLFFSSRLNRNFVHMNKPYTYQLFQKHLNSPLNGLGNIYQIALKELSIIRHE